MPSATPQGKCGVLVWDDNAAQNVCRKSVTGKPKAAFDPTGPRRSNSICVRQFQRRRIDTPMPQVRPIVSPSPPQSASKSGSVVGIDWGNRGGAAGDIETLATRLFCRRADRGLASSDASVRVLGAKRRNTECESS